MFLDNAVTWLDLTDGPSSISQRDGGSALAGDPRVDLELPQYLGEGFDHGVVGGRRPARRRAAPNVAGSGRA